MTVKAGLVHVSQPLDFLIKEIARRIELRQRLEAERGAISDAEFLRIAEATGPRI